MKRVNPYPNRKRIENGRVCQICNTSNTYLARSKFQQWYRFRDSYICYKCYQRLVQHPRYYIKNRKHIRAIQRDYYYRVTKPKNERKKQLILMGVE